MIPIIEKTSLAEAKYTKTFNEFLADNTGFVRGLSMRFDQSDKLLNHLISKYRYNELCTSDYTVFMALFGDVYNEYEDYYKQLLAAYNKNIDIDNITKKTSSRTDTSEGSKETTANTDSSSTHKDYDLPNKQINPTSEDGYLTGKNTNEGTVDASENEEHSNTYESSNVSIDNKDFIRLKQEYLRHIRDIYDDFADRFYDCFLHVY